MNTTFRALYPSVIGENNLAPNTQIGKIVIPNKVYSNENIYMYDKYSRSGEFIENLVTDNIIEFANRWFHLGGVKDVIHDIDELCAQYNVTPYSQIVGSNVLLGNVVLFRGENQVISPISFNNSDRWSRPFYIYKDKDPNITYEKLFEENNGK